MRSVMQPVNIASEEEMTKKGLHANLDAPSLRHAIELENRTQVLGYFSGCMEESMRAFQEGRAPVWSKL